MGCEKSMSFCDMPSNIDESPVRWSHPANPLSYWDQNRMAIIHIYIYIYIYILARRFRPWYPTAKAPCFPNTLQLHLLTRAQLIRDGAYWSLVRWHLVHVIHVDALASRIAKSAVITQTLENYGMETLVAILALCDGYQKELVMGSFVVFFNVNVERSVELVEIWDSMALPWLYYGYSWWRHQMETFSA